MNLKIINSCAGTDPGLPTAGTDPGRRISNNVQQLKLINSIISISSILFVLKLITFKLH